MRQVEQWAHRTRLAEMLSFFEALPRFLFLPRPVLLGSNNEWEILVEGFISKRRVIGAISNLDEPFNPKLILQQTLMAKRRETSLGTMEPIYRELSNGFEKVCLAEALGGCRGKIVRAHTLQRAAFQAHAHKGHVYEIDPFKVGVAGHWPTLIGIQKATTLTGFCEHHDGTLFRPIETEQFDSRPQQFFMHHYRAVASAFYNRAYKAKVLERAYIENAKKPGIGSLETFVENIRINRAETKELRRHKCIYEQHLQAGNWSAVEGHAWIGTRAPDVFAADFFGPRKNLQGAIVQDTKSLRPLNWLSLTVTATADDRALVLLCAEKGSSLLASCVSSLRRTPRDRRTMAVVNYIVCQLENFIMLPIWWEPLGDRTKRLFVNAYDSRYFPRELPHVCEWGLSEVRV
jgi:hypothetical protein